jgi:hypothetical protein
MCTNETFNRAVDEINTHAIWICSFLTRLKQNLWNLFCAVGVVVHLRAKLKKSNVKFIRGHALEAHRWRKGIAPLILKFGFRWRWPVKFIPQTLYPRGRSIEP